MELFVGKNCIPCKNLKIWLEANNISVPYVIAEDDMDRAISLGVVSLPTLHLDDDTLVKGADNIMAYFKGEDIDE